MSLFHVQNAGPISTKFCTDLHRGGSQHKYYPANLNPWPQGTQAPKPKQTTGEKTLLYKKWIEFFPSIAGPWLASVK